MTTGSVIIAFIRNHSSIEDEAASGQRNRAVRLSITRFGVSGLDRDSVAANVPMVVGVEKVGGA
jgi:hypothetical protein